MTSKTPFPPSLTLLVYPEYGVQFLLADVLQCRLAMAWVVQEMFLLNSGGSRKAICRLVSILRRSWRFTPMGGLFRAVHREALTDIGGIQLRTLKPLEIGLSLIFRVVPTGFCLSQGFFMMCVRGEVLQPAIITEWKKCRQRNVVKVCRDWNKQGQVDMALGLWPWIKIFTKSSYFFLFLRII